MAKERLLSLDVFRGATIALMILVNDPGSWSHVYGPLLHADWHGLTPTDLVFPFFVFIMGVAISLPSPKTGEHRSQLLKKSIKRTFILFGIGLFLNAFPYFEIANLRIPGVLQRIALVFIACFVLYHYLSIKRIYQVGIGLLVIYWVLMMFIPVPGYGPANLDPDSNMGAWLDQVLMTGHMYKEFRDPEGLLSTLPSIVTGLMGILMGRYLFTSEDKNAALVKIFVVAGVVVLVSLIWDMHFPINKKIWTSSYVLMTGGLGIYCFAALYWLLDVQKIQGSWVFPFRVFGLNAITVYGLSSILINTMDLVPIGGVSMREYIFALFASGLNDPKLASLLFALMFTGICYIPIWVMYKKGVFLKV